jgi:hypothetical protein
MKTLPTEVINHILEYQGYHTWRNGKYIKRISQKDTRYNILSQRPIPRENSMGVCVSIWKKTKEYEILYHIESYTFNTMIYWVLTINKFYDDNSSYDCYDRIQYILE